MKHSYWISIPFALLALVMAVTMGRTAARPQGTGDQFVYLPLIANGYDAAWSWTAPLTFTLTPAPSTSPSPLLAIDSTARLHLLWGTSNYSAPKFITHTYLSQGIWSTPAAVAQSQGIAYTLYPPVVMPDGSLHLLWLNNLTSSGPCRLLYAVFTGNTWSPEEEVYRITSSCSLVFYNLQGMVHPDDAGRIHATILASDGLSSKIYHRVREMGIWSAPVEIAHPQHFSFVWPDRYGGVRLYGNDYASPPALFYSYWQNGRFLVQDRQAAGKVSGRQSQLDALNNLHIFWTAPVPIPGGSVTGLYHQCLDQDLNLSAERVVSGAQSVSSVIKAAGQERRFALAWRESSADRIQLAVWNGCDTPTVQTVPMPTGATWTPTALALSDHPGKVCLLASSPAYPLDHWVVVCANVAF